MVYATHAVFITFDEMYAKGVKIVKKTVGQRIKELREGFKPRKMTIEKLAEKSGVDKTTIYRWEHGKSRPEEKNLEAVAKVLKVDVDNLLGIAPPPEPDAISKVQLEAIAEATAKVMKTMKSQGDLENPKLLKITEILRTFDDRELGLALELLEKLQTRNNIPKGSKIKRRDD